VTCKKLFKGLGIKIPPYIREKKITSITADSRSVKKGSVYIALEGREFDGHKFIEEAFKGGAKFVIVDRKKRITTRNKNIIKVNDTRKALSVLAKNFYNSPSEKLKTIGITGTNGKTTTSIILQSILTSAAIPAGLIGTIEYRCGSRTEPASRTTPDAVETNKLLDRMVKSGLKAVVMEVSSHALDQKRVDDVLFDAALFTNISHEHLDYHKNIEEYFKSKQRIFQNLKKLGFGVINADDERISKMGKILNVRKITYGFSEDADIKGEVKLSTLEGSSFIVYCKNSNFLINTKLPGHHNIYNILAAIAVSKGLGISDQAIKKGVLAVSNVTGRLEPVLEGQDFKVFIDYAHTHDALGKILSFLKKYSKGKIITVFGCGGDRDRAKRPLMGRVAQRLSNFVYITSDNPRNEDPERIARGIVSGMDRRREDFSVVLDRKKAINNALKKAKKNDIVLIAGKGHEKTQVIEKDVIPFDDKKVAESVLCELVKKKAKRSRRLSHSIK